MIARAARVACQPMSRPAVGKIPASFGIGDDIAITLESEFSGPPLE